MKLTIRDLMTGVETLGKLVRLNMKAKLAYHVGRNARIVKTELAEINKIQNALFVKYGDKQEDNNYVVPIEKVELFSAEREELLDQEIDIDIRPFSFDLFGDMEIPAETYVNLWYMFTEEPKDGLEPEIQKK